MHVILIHMCKSLQHYNTMEVRGGPLCALVKIRPGFGPSTSKSWAKCARLHGHRIGMGRRPEYNTVFYYVLSIYIYIIIYISYILQ